MPNTKLPDEPNAYTLFDTPPSDGDVPPRNAAKDKAPKQPRTPRKPQFQTDLETLYQTLGGAVMLVSINDGLIILEASEKRAAELYAVSVKYPKVKKALENLMVGGVVSAMVLGHASTALAIAANHGWNAQRIGSIAISVFRRPTKPAASADSAAPATPSAMSDEDMARYIQSHLPSGVGEQTAAGYQNGATAHPAQAMAE